MALRSRCLSRLRQYCGQHPPYCASQPHFSIKQNTCVNQTHKHGHILLSRCSMRINICYRFQRSYYNTVSGNTGPISSELQSQRLTSRRGWQPRSSYRPNCQFIPRNVHEGQETRGMDRFTQLRLTSFHNDYLGMVGFVQGF